MWQCLCKVRIHILWQGMYTRKVRANRKAANQTMGRGNALYPAGCSLPPSLSLSYSSLSLSLVFLCLSNFSLFLSYFSLLAVPLAPRFLSPSLPTPLLTLSIGQSLARTQTPPLPPRCRLASSA
jgi:hypothetical protein